MARTLHHHLHKDGQLCRLNRQATRLLRIEQILGDIVRLIDLASDRFAERTLLDIELLRPEAVERRHLRTLRAGNIHAAVQFQCGTYRLALIHRATRQDQTQHHIVLAYLVTGALFERLALALLTARACSATCGIACGTHLDRGLLRVVGRTIHPDFGSPDAQFARALRHQNVGYRVVDALGHRAVHNRNRLTLRRSRTRQHVEALERWRHERIVVRLGVERKLGTKRLTLRDNHRSVERKCHLLVGTHRPDGTHRHHDGKECFYKIVHTDKTTI